MNVEIYGPGGFDTSKPNNNVVSSYDVPDSPVSLNADATEKTVRLAMGNLRAYRDQASPTNAQTVAVVKLLCRVVLGLIRREFNDNTATD